jgi:ABC-2 type transport system permease protein
MQAALLGLATTICVVIGRGFGLTIPVAGIAGITIGVTLLGVDFGLLALAIGAWAGRRGTALGITASIAAASYLVSSLAPVVAWIRPARYASLFYWSVGNAQLTTGLTATSSAILAATGIALLAAAAAAFNHLDLH